MSLAIDAAVIRIRNEDAKRRAPTYCPQSPTPKQKLFLDQTNLEVFFGGAAGGAKSSALLMAALQHVTTPKYSAILFRRTYADLALPDALMSRAQEWLSPHKKRGLHWSDKDKTWTFPSGATLTFGYLETENDKYRYQGCFAPGHDMLTESGWKRIEDVQVGESVATLNPNTREVEYRPVSATQRYAYGGEMVSVYAKSGVSFEVTPNHTVWWSSQSRGRGTNYKLKKIEAQGIRKTMRIPQWGKWSGINAPGEVTFPKSRRSPAHTFAWSDYAEFLGWFVSEGYFADKHGGIGLAQQKQSGVVKIKALLTRMGVKWHYDGRKFVFGSVELSRHLRAHTGRLCDSKRLPRYLFSYRPEDIWPVFRGLMDGDGTWYADGRNGKKGIYKTTSNQLADDVSELALMCGYRPTKMLEKPRPANNRFGAGRPIWRVSLCAKGNADTSLETGKITRTLNSSGYVCCVTVPPYHTILIRHNGRVCWSGQSAYQFIGFDEVTQFTESQYLYLFSRLRRLAGANVPLRMRSASNPGGVGGRWVHQRFIPENFSPIDAEDVKVFWKTDGETKRAFIPSRLDDNPYLDREAYAASLQELDPVTREQLLRGDWRITDRGDIYPMWDEQYHVISWPMFNAVYHSDGIPKHWPLAVLMDNGTTEGHPNVTSWFTTAPANAPLSGSVFLFRGHCVYDQTVNQIAQFILEKSKGERDRVALWRNGHEGSSERISYNRDFGLPFSPWKADRNRGIAQVRNYLEIRQKQDPHPFKPEVFGRPMFYLVVDDDQLDYARDDRGLARWREEFPAYHYKQLKSGDPSFQVVPYPLFNDAMDTIRAAGAEYFAPLIPLSRDETVEKRVMELFHGRTFDGIMALPPLQRDGALHAYQERRAEIMKQESEKVIVSNIRRYRRSRGR